MNINQKINFKSWRLGEGPKLYKHDYYPPVDAAEFWASIGRCSREPLLKKYYSKYIHPHPSR